MEAVRAPLPELDFVRDDPESAPVGRQWNLAGRVTFGQFGDLPFQPGPVGDHAALDRDPRPQPRPRRAGPEVRLGLFPRHPDDMADHPHLPLQEAPEEDQRRARIGGEVPPLVRPVVGVENKPLGRDPLEQDDPRARLAIGVGTSALSVYVYETFIFLMGAALGFAGSTTSTCCFRNVDLSTSFSSRVFTPTVAVRSAPNADCVCCLIA